MKFPANIKQKYEYIVNDKIEIKKNILWNEFEKEKGNHNMNYLVSKKHWIKQIKKYVHT